MIGIAEVTAGLAGLIGPLETPEDWHRVLLLPENYKVESIKFISHKKIFEVTLSSDALPEDGLYIQIVHRWENGQAYFDHIRLTKWDGEQWVEVEEMSRE